MRRSVWFSLLVAIAAWHPVAVAQPSAPAEGASRPRGAGAPFAVEVTGRGRPMLLIPGFTSSGRVWDGTVAAFRATHECHVFTLAGFSGQPPMADSVKLATWREAIARYIRERNLVRPVIVGHSLGGFLALDLAATHPDLVGAVINVDGLPFLPAATVPTATAEAVRPMALQIRAGMAGSDSARFAGQVLQSFREMVRDTTQIPAQLALAVRSDRPTAGQAYFELMTTDLRPAMPRITAPVLNVHVWKAYAKYGQTRAGIEAMARQQYAGLARQQTVIHDEAYHFVMLDAPAWLHGEMQRFLSSTGN